MRKPGFHRVIKICFRRSRDHHPRSHKVRKSTKREPISNLRIGLMDMKIKRFRIKVCIKIETLMKLVLLVLCRRLGIPVLPKGWMMFDPALAKAVGINQAILYQKMAGWVDYNARRGHNQKKGRTWTYNSFQEWGKDMTWVHHKTIQKYVGELKAAGLLVVDQLSPVPTNRVNWYSVVTREESADGSQLLLWPEQRTPMMDAKDSDVSIGTSKAKPSNAKRKPATSRAGATTANKPAAVAVFSSANQPGEFSDKPEMPEQRATRNDESDSSPLDGTDLQTTAMPSPSSAPPPPQWMREFWTECTDVELHEMMQKHGLSRLLAEKEYAFNAKGVERPAAFARWRLQQGLGIQQDGDTETETQETDATAEALTPESVQAEIAELEAQLARLDAPVAVRDVETTPTLPRGTGKLPPESAWNIAYSQLEIQLDRASFDTFARGAKFLGFEGGVFQIGVRNSYAQNMLQHRLYRDVRRIASDIAGEKVELTFEVIKHSEPEPEQDELPLFKMLALRGEIEARLATLKAMEAKAS